MKDSADMFDTSGEDQDLPSSSNGTVNGTFSGWSGVPFASLPRLHPHGSATPAPPPVPGPCHTVAVKLPLKVNGMQFRIGSTTVPSQRPSPGILHFRTQVLLRPLTHLCSEMCGTASMCGCRGARRTSTRRSKKEGRFWLAGANFCALLQLIPSPRWQLVVSALTSAPITSSRELEQAIMSYNTRYKDKYDWSFDGLHHLFEEVLEPEEVEAFFDTTMPGMVKLLTASPSLVTSPLPLLRAGRTHSITLSQQQVL